MEKELIACSLNSVQDYRLILEYLDTKGNNFSKEFKYIISKIGDYYNRDKSADHVSASIIKAIMEGEARNDKILSRLSGFLDEAVASSASLPNVRAAILAAKRQEVADKLSMLLVSGETGGEKVQELIAKLSELDSDSIVEDGIKEEEVYQNVDLVSLMHKEYDSDNLIKIYPESVNRRLDGGAKKGHHITVFARPESGKTAFVINAACGFARQDKRVLYVINEDRAEDIIIRTVSNLSGMDKHTIRDNPEEASAIARQNGWDNIIVVNLSPGSPNKIRYLIKKYNPDCVIIDQLRNIEVGADSRVNQLEKAATSIRNIGKELNVLMLSVTQAGDSGENKLVLEKGDVDFSNTGIPAQCDVLIGIGMNKEYEAQGLRVISLSKNKIGGNHENFPVKINTQVSRYISV